LDHEVRDHAVEDRSVVETLRDELSEVPRRDGHRRVEELDLHIAHRRLKEDGRHEAAIRSTYLRVHLRCVRGETEGLSRQKIPRLVDRGGRSISRFRRNHKTRRTATMTAKTNARNGNDVRSDRYPAATTV